MGIIMKQGIEYTGSDKTLETALIYSEEEREVGVWTDGKPLYQKTFNFVNVTTLNAWVSTNHNISNIDKITDYNAIFTRTSDNWTVTADHFEGSSTAYISSTANKTQIHFKIAISAGTYNGSFTIRYTKTTDTAGSGIWTTTGEYAHHYSTDEKVVGTWIDGSTIYEKTFDFGSDINISYSSWTSSGISITNVDTITGCGGISSNGTYYPLMAYHSNDSINLLACRDGNYATPRYITIQYTKSS